MPGRTMPAAQPAFLPELERALHHIAPDQCGEMVRRVVDFFLADPARFNAEHIALFDRVLGRLTVAVDDRVLTELALRLAPIRTAPPALMRRLADHPVIAIAAPVLTRAPLTDHDLVA